MSMRDKVKKGYEEGDYPSTYREDRDLKDFEVRLFNKMFEIIGDSCKVLDLGCGTGVPFDRFLVKKGYEVKGIDLVEKHVEKAKENVPEADYEVGDLLEIDIEQEKYEAIISLYTIFHVPREKHNKVLGRIHEWLKPGGCLLLTVGIEEGEYEGEFVGSKMTWSSYSKERNIQMVKKAGFDILEKYEQDDEENHLWILARK